MKFICKTLLALFFTFLVNSQIVYAEGIDNSNQSNKVSLEITENVKNEEKATKSKRSEADIFGDEQTFPFVAGLGKNAAH